MWRCYLHLWCYFFNCCNYIHMVWIHILTPEHHWSSSVQCPMPIKVVLICYFLTAVRGKNELKMAYAGQKQTINAKFTLAEHLVKTFAWLWITRMGIIESTTKDQEHLYVYVTLWPIWPWGRREYAGWWRSNTRCNYFETINRREPAGTGEGCVNVQ